MSKLLSNIFDAVKTAGQVNFESFVGYSVDEDLEMQFITICFVVVLISFSLVLWKNLWFYSRFKKKDPKILLYDM